MVDGRPDNAGVAMTDDIVRRARTLAAATAGQAPSERDFAAFILQCAEPYELMIGPWPALRRIAKDIASGALEAALHNGIDPKHYVIVDRWRGLPEED